MAKLKEKYYVVSMNCDGEWSLSEYETLEEVIEEYGINEPEEDYNEDDLPAHQFTNHIDDYNEGNVLIRGNILLPKPKTVVKKWEFREND